MTTVDAERRVRIHGRGSRLRVAGVVVAVLAVLVFINLAQVDGESELAFRSTGVFTPNVERVLAERRAVVVSNAVAEYAALVAAAVGVTLAFAGPRLLDAAAGGCARERANARTGVD